MKKILSIFLTFVLIIGALPLSAQEDNASMPTITRKDLSDLIDPNELQKQMNKEHRRYNFSVSDDEAAFQDFVKFQDKRKQEFLQASNSGTYREKQQNRNLYFGPTVYYETVIPDSKYFSDEGLESRGLHNQSAKGILFRYILENYYQNFLEESLERQKISLKDYEEMAKSHVQEMVLNRAMNPDFQLSNKLDHPINYASYLVAYQRQIDEFVSYWTEMFKIRKSRCEDPKWWGPQWGYGDNYTPQNDPECIEAFTVTKMFDRDVLAQGSDALGFFFSIAADEVNKCLVNLHSLEVEFIPFQKIEDYLEEKLPQDGICAFTKNEIKEIIAANTITRAEALSNAQPKGFGQKLLKVLDTISLAGNAENMESKLKFESYIELKYGEEKLQELKDSGKEAEELKIAINMASSLNTFLATLAVDLISYGKVFYYPWEKATGRKIDDSGNTVTYSDIGQRFADTWHEIALSEENTPISELTRDAVSNSAQRKTKDDAFLAKMDQVNYHKGERATTMLFANMWDVAVDPTMALAPFKFFKSRKALKLGAKYAPKTTRKVYNASKNVGKGVQTAKTAITDSKVGRGVPSAKNAVKNSKIAQNVQKAKQKTGNFVYDAFDDWSDMGRHLDDVNVKSPNQIKGKTENNLVVDPNEMKQMPQNNTGRPINTAQTPAQKPSVQKPETPTTPTDVVEDFAKTPTPKPEPTTALDPQKANPAKEFDNLVANAGNAESNPAGYIGFNRTPTNTNTPAKLGSGTTDASTKPYTRAGFKFYDDAPKSAPGAKAVDNVSGTYTPPGFKTYGDAPTTMPGNKTPNIGDTTPGFRDYTKGNNNLPGARTPEGPNAKNPYDVRNQAGGTPDTPGTPQRDLSGLNKNISNTPKNQTTPLTQSEADDIVSKRHKDIDDSNIESRTERWAVSDWKKADRTYHGTVKVEPYPEGKYNSITVTQYDGKKTILGQDPKSFFEGKNLLKITKADGTVETVLTDDFRFWLDGRYSCPACKISEREKQAMQGYDDIMSKLSNYEADVLYHNRLEKLPSHSSYNTPYKVKEWEELDKRFHGTIEVQFDGGDVRVIKANGGTIDYHPDYFRKWIDGNVPGCPECKISERERSSMKGLDDFISKHDEIVKAKQLEYERIERIENFIATGKDDGTNYDLFYKVDIESRGMVKSWAQKCEDIKSCDQLLNQFIVFRGQVQNDVSELQKLFAKATGNNDVETFYKALSDSNSTPYYIQVFFDDTKLRNFILNNGNIPDIGKVADPMIDGLGVQDLTKLLKSNIPEDLKSLRQLATDDDWKYVLGRVRSNLQTTLARDVEKLDELLLIANRKAPKLVEKIRNGATPHITTLKKAGVDQRTANAIVDYYREIEKIKAALK